MRFVSELYNSTKDFPKEELYGLVSQMRRCAISIPSNIAEGHGRGTDAEFSRFLSIAYGSALELETQLYIALKLEYLETLQHKKLSSALSEISKMLYVLRERKLSSNL